jgi:replicative DNA helicase
MLQTRQYGGGTVSTPDIIEIAPHSIEAEQTLLGSLLADSTQWDEIAEIVCAEDFYQVEHRHLFEAMGRLKSAGQAVDSITLANQLTIAGVFEKCGGKNYLVRLQSEHDLRAGLVEHAGIIRERSVLRRIRTLGHSITRACNATKLPQASELVEQIESGLMEIQSDRGRGQRGYSSVSDLIPGFIDELDKRAQSGSAITGVPSGFNDLDGKLAGLQKSDLIIVAGRPSMGKTAFAMNIAENAAIHSGIACGVFSMEMSKDQLFNRMVSSVGGINATRMRTGQLEDADWNKVTAATTELKKVQLLIDDTPGLSPSELRSRARRMKREANIGLIVIDYLQLMQGDGKSENRTNEISEISRRLKALAKELELPVIALSQLNRSLEQRFDKRPVMADLRESGAIEQEADVILFVYRDEVYNPESPAKGVAEIIIGKQRNGPIGQVLLQFQGEFTRFINQSGAHHHYV